MRIARLLALLALLPTPLSPGERRAIPSWPRSRSGGSRRTWPRRSAISISRRRCATSASLPDDWRAQEMRGERQGNTGALHYSNIPNEIGHLRSRPRLQGRPVRRGRHREVHGRAERQDAAEGQAPRGADLRRALHRRHPSADALRGREGEERADRRMEPDRGGNRVKVRYLGIETNLHSVWDTHAHRVGSGHRRRVRDVSARVRDARPARRGIADAARSSTGSTSRTTRPIAQYATRSATVLSASRLRASSNIGIVYERLLRGGLQAAQGAGRHVGRALDQASGGAL